MQAERGDEEVLRKLTDYKSTLKLELGFSK